SNTSSDYGRPFGEIFKSYDFDFFKVDPMLFSPAKVIVTNANTGKSFTAGELNKELLTTSFGL
ncbi:MAG: methenyltetrahydromethanopterin cyclohydrolase, partial [Proteobacteria bacterium]|nr:methenyltetrahydromethanopterin cyclohydrolase [Pseudomonadota bacterium]